MLTSYKAEDVTMLLKDITGLVQPLENSEREKFIQSGVHYSEMIPAEHLPTEQYMRTFNSALDNFSLPTAQAAKLLAKKIVEDKGKDVVLVSLARAGTPIGIILKHFIQRMYSFDPPHYTISIIRGKGIDKNAVNYILERHIPESICFIDGWTGKGAIKHQLDEAMKDFPRINPEVCVLSDPAFVSGKCGTHEDFLIPSSCLNSTVSGLISRTFFRPDIIGENDFHGALYHEKFKDYDMSYMFIERTEVNFDKEYHFTEPSGTVFPLDEVKAIAEKYKVRDINFIKPGIGEATRVLLRRIPFAVLVSSKNDEKRLGHIYRLAEEKNVPVIEYPLVNYRACGIIRDISDS